MSVKSVISNSTDSQYTKEYIDNVLSSEHIAKVSSITLVKPKLLKMKLPLVKVKLLKPKLPLVKAKFLKKQRRTARTPEPLWEEETLWEEDDNMLFLELLISVRRQLEGRTA